jgi:hypothetical protein
VYALWKFTIPDDRNLVVEIFNERGWARGFLQRDECRYSKS